MKRFRIECGVSQASGTDAIAMNVHGAARTSTCASTTLRVRCCAMCRTCWSISWRWQPTSTAPISGSGEAPNRLTDFGENWRRCLHFSIPVRELEAWQHSDVHELVAETLGFLSDDSYTFEFREADGPVQPKEYYFPNLIDASMEHDEVALFSGGLDSFAGSVEDIVTNGALVTFVGHYSSTKVRNVQENLIEALKQRGFDETVSYIPVWVTNTGVTAREFSQRMRSFLFLASASLSPGCPGKTASASMRTGSSASIRRWPGM